MSIQSYFYDTSAGNPDSLITETAWAEAHPQIGLSTYGVDGLLDFQVTAHPSTPFAVNVHDGKAWGHGVLDISDATETVVCDAPDAGTSRWDLICIRRNWAPVGGLTTVTSVEGGSSKAIPAGREIGPGTLDDQPLALVQWTAGQTQPTAIVDLRVWAGDGAALLATDSKVLDYLDRIGTQVNIGGVVYVLDAEEEWARIFEEGKTSLYGFGAALDGLPAAGQTGFMIQSGTMVGISDNSGFTGITFPRPFPNGLLTCVILNGDTSIDRMINRVLEIGVSGLPWNTGRKDRVVYSLAYSNANGNYQAVTGQIHRVNYIAIGW